MKLSARLTETLVRIALLLIAAIATSESLAADGPASPLSPQEALDGLKLDPNLKVELAAAEPDVIDPVFIAFDSRNRMWVVQMGDYPNGPADGEPGQSSIRVLSDADHDGRYTDPVVFADGLLFANSLMFWQDGVLVTTDGRLDFMADRDGDGKAEVRETWFKGFARENPQLRANSPTLGHDGKIYVANGLRGGKIIAANPAWGEKPPVDISGRDFRFNPLTGDAEATTGNGQFGMSFDDFGHRFLVSNRNPCIQVVLSQEDVARNPDVLVPALVADACVSGEASRIYPISKFWVTSNLHAGQFTAACGLHLYRGDLLPPEFYGNAFTCDPTGDLIHRELLEGDGVVFKGRSPYEGREFLASEDTWFRPVNLATGPDGALYVADMYRAVIEHPQFVPDELKNRPDQHLGKDKGRIYRIVPRVGWIPGKQLAIPSHETATADLPAFFNHPNVFQRETAFRLLVERQDPSAQAALVNGLKVGTPQGRTLALWSLALFDQLPYERWQLAMREEDPNVMEQCFALAPLVYSTSDLRNRKDIAEKSYLVGLARGYEQISTSSTPRLRFQLALALKSQPDALAGLLTRGLADPWLTTAALISANEQIGELPGLLLKRATPDVAVKLSSLVETIGRMFEVIGRRAIPSELAAAMKTADDLSKREPDQALAVRSALWERLATGIRSKGKNPIDLLATAAASSGLAFEDVLDSAAIVAVDSAKSPAERIDALKLLDFASFPKAGPILAQCLASTDSSIAAAAVNTLAKSPNEGVAGLLLENYSSRPPALRREILAALFRTESRITPFLNEIDAGRIPPAEIDAIRLQQLGRVKDPALRERANKIIAANRPADRAEVIERYQPALARKGDPAHGREVFTKNCTQCHRIAGLGVNVAPDISDSRVKLPTQLLTDILDPNRAIDNNYFNYMVVDRDGTVLTGLIATETSTSITLRQPEDKRVTISRESIEQIKSTGQSLMPVGLEKTISVEDMSDLISFIKNWRYLDGTVPKEVIR